MKKGFTLIELLIITGIIALLAALAVPALRNFQLKSDLENSAEEMINVLRLAQQKTVSSEGASSWGVYFSTSTSPPQYTLFRGKNYLSRDASADEIHKISKDVLISGVDLGGGPEVVFNRFSGTSQQQGRISLVLKTDASKTKTIYIEESGQVGGAEATTPSELNRVKDSRHVHVDYSSSRFINTATESIILTFTYDIFTQTETIPIAGNMQNGQIDWEGEVDVGGEIQKLKIHTHRLNNPDTQFSVHRDRRYNNRALKIGIDDSPDPDLGNILEYSADGLSTISTSIYASNIQRQ